MMDEGKEDIKIIAIPFKDPMWNSFKKIEDLPVHIIEEMRHFFGVYKQLEGKKMTVLEMSGVDVAKKTIADNIEVYNKTFIERQ